jgi:hypothetical protein
MLNYSPNDPRSPLPLAALRVFLNSGFLWLPRVGRAAALRSPVEIAPARAAAALRMSVSAAPSGEPA